ncbi:MAG: DNA-processing protein DprA [Bdellovibrionota bacterium]
MMSSARLLDLHDYDPEMAALQRANPLVLPSTKIWVRSRDWESASPPRRKFSVGIVGTRKPSEYGVRVTEELVKRLSAYDMCIVSGGAFGIDRIAHEAALERDLSTRAWLVGPIDDPSPRSHRHLFEKIERSSGSALLVPGHLNDPESGARRHLGAWAWLARNAWVGAEVDALVVVEAYLKSGTWRTAKDAADLGKSVFVVPGSLFTGSSCGTNKMISESYALPIWDLGELTETLVVLALQRSYNIAKGS